VRLVLATLLFATLNPSWAQDTGAVTSTKQADEVGEISAITYGFMANLIRSTQTRQKITFQWNYACPENRPCTFVCRGAGGGGGSDHVTRLDIYLGTLPLNGVQQERAAAIFYETFPHESFLTPPASP
jgi:hypothetical protein